MRTDRRTFLKSALASSSLVTFGAATVPTFLGRSAVAAGAVARAKDRVLVVVQLIGGNDGLNTVVPHAYDGYARGRRVLRIPGAQALPVTKEIGLHPGLGGLAKLMEANRLSIVQGVGYPNPDRSHFRSMEIWESARTDPKAIETGWLGRLLDAHPPAPGADAPAFRVGGGSLPLAFRAKAQAVPSFETLDEFRLRLAGDDAAKRESRTALDDLARADRSADDALLGFLRRSTLAAYESSRRLEQITTPEGDGATKYPEYGLARRLKLIAQIIKAGFGTRLYYTALDGFDTHANQLASHAGLMTELGDSLAAFHADLAAAGQGDRVAVLAFSEFGRRVAENASLGTDHGAAAPCFVIGPVARPGLVGDHPSFDRLDDGDLIHHTDFRRLYSALLGPWLGLDAPPIVGEGFDPLPLFRA